mgnify:CR=1 FL=1|tara:strand:- start:455 stop:619 length:165 start_codon:yes stop_codon:yes gene_type:complete
MPKYFKKPNGLVIEATPDHDMDSLKERFEECDVNGKSIKVEKKATKKPSKKKEK